MERDNSLTYPRGIFVLSLDTEFAWGTPPSRVPLKEVQFRQNREVIQRLLALFEKHTIPATWAIVGKLFQEDGSAVNSIWHGRDVVKSIKMLSVPQEIASHSFAHKNFAQHTFEEANQDLDACLKAARELDIELKSFVFPYNKIGNMSALSSKGFLCYRGIDERWYKKMEVMPALAKVLMNALEELLIITPPVVMASRRGEGMVEIPGSTPYMPKDSILKYIPTKHKVSRACKGIDKATREKKIFHLWLHPFNIASSPDDLLQGLEEIIRYAVQKQKEGSLDIMTMSQVAQLYYE